MPLKDAQEALAWLRREPSLKAMCAHYPAEWAAVEAELARMFEQGRTEDLKQFLVPPALQPGGKGLPSRGPRLDNAVARMIRARMAFLAIRQTLLAGAAGVQGRIRFNLFNGFITQKLLFARELERKPVSLLWFRLLWPLVWQRRRLMPLVQSKGIYCFYSRRLVEELARLVDGRPCLEIAAGDGTLSRFLKAEGVDVRASDDHSWTQSVQYPDWVEMLDAREALRRYAPEVVICSWPPTNNRFEEQVFRTASVRLYIVIGSQHRFAAGNWQAYRSQSGFDLEQDDRLGRLVLPPELGAAVYLFRRKAPPI